jgi:hypothetical protein
MTHFWNQLDESFILTIDVKMTGQVSSKNFLEKIQKSVFLNQTALHPRFFKKMTRQSFFSPPSAGKSSRTSDRWQLLQRDSKASLSKPA